MSKLKIGVIGAGHLGKIHIKLIKEIANYELVGFYDVDENAVSKVVSEYGVTHFPIVDDLIDACDVLDIVTPTIFHHQYAVKALKKSKHLFIEKPLTHTLIEGKSLLKLAKEANVKVQIGHVERFNPAFVAAVPYVDNPLFIESHRLAQFNPRGTDVSVVLDLMIHDIDIILSLVKANIKRISASGVAVVSETPDIANVRLEFDNGCVANLTASRLSMKNMRKTRLFQKDAYLSIDFLEKTTDIIRLKKLEGEADPLAITIDLPNNRGVKQIYFEKPECKEINAIKEELTALAYAINNDTQTAVTIEDGYKALDIAFKIIEKLNLTSDFVTNDTISN
ncbi:MAG: Gfo/Idh/MocA family oxidoreductase [Bacteroidetes bacterium]|nr:Gfo/Idh/MocA family oxidoreductase [Bacteroidota bacterium]